MSFDPGRELVIKGRVARDEPMARHTTWRIGGPADLFIEPRGVDDLTRVLEFVHRYDLPLTVIGNGSNVLVGDGGIRGAVVKIGQGMSGIKVEGNAIRAEAGAKLAQVGSAALKAGLGGLEFAVGIPASIGGAVLMNAGANGRSMGDLVDEVTIVYYDGRLCRKSSKECAFGYRHSQLQIEPAIVVEAILQCYPKSRDLIKEEIEACMLKRRNTQPLEYPSAGSVFKNPPGDAAGRLIDLAGAKGMSVGDAQVSEKHANFIINRGTATARDVRELIEKVRALVKEKFGMELELEVRLLGEH
ncbi:MAG: UDP-N-acetylmuramate dehydrogenase [Bacillota bacterium]|uniref:UDP-N-acetylmuramate dehydrogenase n=1 Tax=Desulforudis sp. DRI-14 TaxID=3459793 RepID=UPI00348A7E02